MMQHLMQNRLLRRLLYLNLGVFLIAVMGFTVAQAGTYDPELVKKAKAEGKLMWFGCIPDHKELLEAYKDRFGIDYEFVHGACYPTLERFRAEQKAGRHNVDTFYAFTDVMLTMKNGGYLAPYKSVFQDDYPKRFHVKDNMWSASKPHAYFFTVNTRSIPENLRPKKWADWLNPPDAWKDKVSVFDARSSSAAYAVLYSLWKQYGNEKMEQIYKNISKMEAAIYTSSTGGIQACVTGEKPLPFYMMNNHIARALSKKAPLAVITPEDGTTHIVVNTAIIKNAPHPNAARLMVDFILDPEGGQKVYMEELNQYALHPQVAPPEGFPKFSGLDLWDVNWEEAESMRSKLQERFGTLLGVGAK